MNIRGRALYYFFDMFSGNGFSRFVGRASDVRLPAPLNRTLFSLYSRIFGVDVAEIEKPLSEYENFNNFFTRKLKDGARAMDSREDVLISPCDGNVQEFGRMEKGRLLQVKGKSYGVDELLMDAEESKRFQNGCFATIYLSPRNYHRVHAPCRGRILGFRYLQGKLYSVTTGAVEVVDNIFVRNERVVTYLATERGMIGIVMVGATSVGRITLSYDSLVTNRGFLSRKVVYENPREAGKGDEIGVFNLGSTVILLTEKRSFSFDGEIETGRPVQFGRPLLHVRGG